MIALILDTSVIVAALCGKPTATSRQVLRAVVERRASLVASEELFDEYARKLRHPEVAARHPYSPARLRQFLAELRELAPRIDPKTEGVPACPDPDDAHLWALLATVPEALLVTWEKALLGSQDFPGRVLTPPGALERLGR